MKAKLNYMSRKCYLKKDISVKEMSFLIFIDLPIEKLCHIM